MPNANGPLAPPPAPYIVLRVTGAEVEVDGQPDALIGRRVDDGHERLGGSWVAWSWDGTALTVTNDPQALQPAFIAASGDSIAVSTSIDRLLELGVPRELDLDALAAFLAIGTYLGDDTPFRAIRALAPAATLRWRPGGHTLTSTPPTFEPAEMSRAEAIDGVIEAMRVAIARRLPADDDRVELPLSGGRDSRHILLELRRQGVIPVRAITTYGHGNDWGVDPPVARQLCARLGIDHVTVAPGRLVADEWRKNRWLGYLADEHAWYLPVADALRSAGTTRTYDGLGGGILSRSYVNMKGIRRLAEAGRWDTLAAHMGKKDEAGRPRFAPLLAPDYRAVLTAERAAARIRAELERHVRDPQPMLSFYLRARAARELNLTATALLSGVGPAEMPMMDADLLAFVASVPPEHLGESFQDELIARAYPEVAGVAYTPNTKPRPSGIFVRQVTRDSLRLLVQHSEGTLVDRPGLLRRALRGGIRGDDWFAWGRRANLLTNLVQLEMITEGRDPGWFR